MSGVGYRVSVLRSNIQKNCAHRHSLIAMFSLLDTYTLYHCEWRGNLARSGGYRAEGWLQVDRGAAHRAQGRAPVRWRRGHVPGAASSTGVAGRNRSHGRGRRQRGAARCCKPAGKVQHAPMRWVNVMWGWWVGWWAGRGCMRACCARMCGRSS